MKYPGKLCLIPLALFTILAPEQDLTAADRDKDGKPLRTRNTRVSGVAVGFGIALFLLVAFDHPVRAQVPATIGNTNLTAFKTNLANLIEAARSSPRLKAADARTLASTSSARAIRSLDPPQLAIEFMPMEYDYSVQQMLPFPGKIGAMARAERQRTEMFRADRLTLEHEIIRDVKMRFYELYLTYRQTEINHETQMLVREMVDVARRQYELGMGSLSDILRAQTELSSLASDSIALGQQLNSIKGMLNALCNRPTTSVIDFVPEVEPVASSYGLNALLALAGKSRPELKSMSAGVDMQSAERAAARKEYLPDLMVRGTYKQMVQRSDDWSLMLGVTVPVAPWSLRKYSSGTARADAAIAGAQSERDDMRNMIAAEVNDALLKMESAGERLRLSKETSIAQAQQALESALAAYRNGKQEFLMLIDIERMLVMARLDYHMATMTLLDSQSQLERAVGLSIDEIDEGTGKANR